jgi:transposase-like protein
MSKGVNLVEITERFPDAETAAEYLESLRWPDGPVCPHCGHEKVYRIKATRDRRRLWKCAGCRKPFTVTIGTIFEASHIPLNKWLIAFHLLCASKKGMSALQLSRMLGITQKSAWFMAHRIRYAMTQPAFASKLSGVVEADETFIGGKPRAGQVRNRQEAAAWRDRKVRVVSLVQRDGDVRSFAMPRAVANITEENVGDVLRTHVDPGTRLMTDGAYRFRRVGREFPVHDIVDHSKGEYARGDVTTNTVEGYFGLLKRGLNGSYHHVSEEHLHRYLAEFDFRYNRRKVTDGARTEAALAMTEGKRLTWADSSSPRALSG